LADLDIPVGGWNSLEPQELSPYYSNVVGDWKPALAKKTPVEVFSEVFSQYPDVHVLTGAPLTNLQLVLEQLPNLTITKMTTQGGYLGDLVYPEQKLSKFKKRKAIRTYNLGNDTLAFEAVNFSKKIENLTYVTKDLCHGFTYTPEIHKTVTFGTNGVCKLLKKCLEHYALSGTNKAMHDPLAMVIMLYPQLGDTIPISMNYTVNDKGHPVFSSVEGQGTTYGLVNYNKEEAWKTFTNLCSDLKPKELNRPQLK
jgi:inosine-uridine nucleoside N-ribohydrolase